VGPCPAPLWLFFQAPQIILKKTFRLTVALLNANAEPAVHTVCAILHTRCTDKQVSTQLVKTRIETKLPRSPKAPIVCAALTEIIITPASIIVPERCAALPFTPDLERPVKVRIADLLKEIGINRCARI
jgi:hypothetical protein